MGSGENKSRNIVTTAPALTKATAFFETVLVPKGIPS